MDSIYSPEKLKEIGEQNLNRLPPATSVAAMLKYELERDAENERLFHAAMFDVGAVKDEAAVQKARLKELERTIKTLVNNHKRNLSFAAVRSIDDALNKLTSATDLQDPKAALRHCDLLTDELDQADISTEERVTLIAVLSASHTNKMRSEVNKLRDGHQATAREVIELKNRVSKLEDLIRALTLQQKSPSSDVPKMTQYLPVSTSHGQTLDLAVQKGMSLKSPSHSRQASPSPSSAALSSPKTEAAARSEKEPALQSNIAKTNTRPQSATVESKVSQTQLSSDKQKQDPNDQKPLPPVPAAQAFPTLSVNVKEMPSKQVSQPTFATPSAAPGKENFQATAVKQSVKQPGTPKAKKWKEPPLFEQMENEQMDISPEPNSKTLFSFDDAPSFDKTASFGGEASGGATFGAPKPASTAALPMAISTRDFAPNLGLKETRQLQNVNKMLGENKAPQAKSMPYTSLVADAMKSIASDLGGGSFRATAPAPKATSMLAEATTRASILNQSQNGATRAEPSVHTGTSNVPPARGLLGAKKSAVKIVAMEREDSSATPTTGASTPAAATVPATPVSKVITSPPLPPTPVHSIPNIKKEPTSSVANNTTKLSSGPWGLPPSQAPPVANTKTFQPSTTPWATPASAANTMMSPPPTPSTEAIFKPVQQSPSSWITPRTAAPVPQASLLSMSGSAPAFQPSGPIGTQTSTPAASEVPRFPPSVLGKMNPEQQKMFMTRFSKI
ncbi:hypothetical protein Q7P37_001739 [Cladosporium fusiforme]